MLLTLGDIALLFNSPNQSVKLSEITQEKRENIHFPELYFQPNGDWTGKRFRIQRGEHLKEQRLSVEGYACDHCDMPQIVINLVLNRLAVQRKSQIWRGAVEHLFQQLPYCQLPSNQPNHNKSVTELVKLSIRNRPIPAFVTQ
jgi:hypothetical protein